MVGRTSSPATSAVKRELVLTRVFDAPRELVFQAWTDPKLLTQWWGPHGFTNPVCELDVRPGGAIRIDMRGPDGNVYPMTGVFHVVVAPEKLLFTSAVPDGKGGNHLQVLNTAIFAERGGKTEITMRAKVVHSSAVGDKMLEGMEPGWMQSLERLEDHLANPAEELATREIVLSRLFDASRELVWKAWTQPEHVAQWWGPRGFTTTIHEMDLRPGGVWRHTMHGPDGTDYRNRIVFLEIERPKRLVYKHEPEKGTEPVNFQVSVTFFEMGGQTGVTVRMLFPSAAAREHVVKKYGAVEGLQQTLERLAEYVSRIY